MRVLAVGESGGFAEFALDDVPTVGTRLLRCDDFVEKSVVGAEEDFRGEGFVGGGFFEEGINARVGREVVAAV